MDKLQKDNSRVAFLEEVLPLITVERLAFGLKYWPVTKYVGQRVYWWDDGWEKICSGILTAEDQWCWGGEFPTARIIIDGVGCNSLVCLYDIKPSAAEVLKQKIAVRLKVAETLNERLSVVESDLAYLEGLLGVENEKADEDRQDG